MTRRNACSIRLKRSTMLKIKKIAAEKNIPAHVLVSLAIRQYIKQQNMRALKQGYIAMRNINRTLANESVFADEQQFFTYEQYLSESE